MEIQHGTGLSPYGPARERPRPPHGPDDRRRVLMFVVRYGLALAVFIAGAVILLAEPDHDVALEAGFSFFGAAFAILLLNMFFRIGVRGQAERDQEDEARAYFDRHGRWPDDA